MFYRLTALILLLSLPNAILAIICLDCHPNLNLNSPEGINVTSPNCAEKDLVGDVCEGSLLMNFHEKNGSATFAHVPNDVLTFSNGEKTTSISTTIWFSKQVITQLVRSINIDSEVLAGDLQIIYNTTRTWKAEELRTKLLDHLYDPLSPVANLTCSNIKGETVQCPNGFCRLSESGTTIVDRRCVRQGKVLNPSGILVQSTTVEESDPEVTMVYACNKPMCNGVETGQKVRNLLFEYQLVNTNKSATPLNPATDASTTSTLTTTTTTSTTTKTPKNKSHSMMDHFQWTLLLLLSSLFIIVSM